jgi:hypothetical protein
MKIAIGLFCLGVLLACQAGPDYEAIKQGVRDFMKSEGVTVEYTIEVDKVEGTFARARVIPVDLRYGFRTGRFRSVGHPGGIAPEVGARGINSR